jgi:hypothetical protein
VGILESQSHIIGKQMPLFSKPVIEIIPERFSCRKYQEKPLPPASLAHLENFLAAHVSGPFGSQPRFKLVAANQQDFKSLRGLGTYGFVQGATAYLVGACQPGEQALEDYGYLMEQFILAATDLGLGTCWLGGSFTRSTFGKKLSIHKGEEIPAVTAIGLMADPEKARDGFIRHQAGSHHRRAWDRLFSEDRFGNPLTETAAGVYAIPLEMVRLGPSASNKQPWQIVRSGPDWHFYLRRTEGYRDGILNKALKIADLQRLDIGIAMCHFELTARELGLRGKWVLNEPDIEKPIRLIEYSVTWSEM